MITKILNKLKKIDSDLELVEKLILDFKSNNSSSLSINLFETLYNDSIKQILREISIDNYELEILNIIKKSLLDKKEFNIKVIKKYNRDISNYLENGK